MPDDEWHYIENQFDNSTRNSFRRAHQQGTFQKDAIENAPAAIKAALQNRHNAAWLPFKQGYELWLNKRGLKKGATLAFDNAMDQLASKDIETIENAFKGGYERGTPEHESAFPQGREPFQHGAANDRINSLTTLHGHCVAFVGALQVLVDAAQAGGAPQAEIDALTLRVLNMSAARDRALAVRDALQGLDQLQNDLNTEEDLARTALHPLREAWADAIYGNLMHLGSVLNTKALRPQIASFFDLAILRETGPDEEEPPPIPPPGP